jgi:hypothetical protein
MLSLSKHDSAATHRATPDRLVILRQAQDDTGRRNAGDAFGVMLSLSKHDSAATHRATPDRSVILRQAQDDTGSKS